MSKIAEAWKITCAKIATFTEPPIASSFSVKPDK